MADRNYKYIITPKGQLVKVWVAPQPLDYDYDISDDEDDVEVIVESPRYQHLRHKYQHPRQRQHHHHVVVADDDGCSDYDDDYVESDDEECPSPVGRRSNYKGYRGQHSMNDGHDHSDLSKDYFLTDDEKAMWRKKQQQATLAQTAFTAAGSGLGFMASGPPGAFIGAGAGSLIGQSISPTPGRPGGKLSRAFLSAVAGGVSPLLIPTAWAPAIASGAVGFFGSR